MRVLELLLDDLERGRVELLHRDERRVRRDEAVLHGSNLRTERRGVSGGSSQLAEPSLFGLPERVRLKVQEKDSPC